MNEIGIGLIGAGFAADLHARMVHELSGTGVRIVGVASKTPAKAQAFAQRHGIARAHDDLGGLLSDPRIAIIDLCVPNYMHKDLVIQAARSGKHVICEKPLTGYFGDGSDGAGHAPRSAMLEQALANADEMLAACREHGVKLMYAENWVYAPALQKVERLARASGGAILDLRAEESHHGSASPYSLHWKYTGGGALIRLGSHPIGGMLHLKRQEGLWRNGQPITARAVTAEVADLTQVPSFAASDAPWIVRGWKDVENWSTVIITFSDGTKGTVFANDVCLGGMKDYLEVYLSNARIQCNFSRNNLIETYAPDPAVFESEYLAEKLETKAGWNFPPADEEWALGYLRELRDFIEAVQFDREPLSDGALGRAVVNVMYSAYLAAEQGRTVQIS
ncbi:MAG: Gfo/Idh/MocA family oxidoreductase [Chloroflexi bacterium]|nr:Gfo/Idh/MocA family oxidoreductase [Chloroflexota bacterium]